MIMSKQRAAAPGDPSAVGSTDPKTTHVFSDDARHILIAEAAYLIAEWRRAGRLAAGRGGIRRPFVNK